MIERIRSWLESSNRAVSPVIGVILMVAITVILAAVIGSFVLGLGENIGNSGPQVSLTASDAGENFKPSKSGTEQIFVIDHQGGADITLGNVRIVIRNADTNAFVFGYDDGTLYTDSSFTTSFSGAGEDEVLVKNGGSTTVSATETLSSGDVLQFKNGGSSTSVLSDNTAYKIQFIDKESGSQIMRQIVTVK